MKRPPKRLRPFSALLALAMLLGLPSTALALRYKPKQDETLSHIAMIHYGASKKYIYLTTVNNITDPAKLSRRKSLWIPTVWKYKIKRGDDLAKLARKYLKDAKRAEFLMWFNKIENPKDIKAGTTITIPFLIRHRVQEGQNMVDLARRYYFKSKPTGLLRKFNDKRSNALKPGEIILIPIYDPEAATDKVKQRLKRNQEREARAAREARERAKRLAAAKARERIVKEARQAGKDKGQPDGGKAPTDKPDPAREDPTAVLDDPKLEPLTPAASPPADVKLVQQAFELYRDGEYELARANLVRVLEEGRLTKADESQAREVLANCLVAMDQIKEAEHEFVRLLMVAPDLTLDPVTTSPKVLEVFRRARGSR